MNQGIRANSYLDIARRTTEWLGVDFHPIPVDETAVASRLEDVVWYSECPLPDVNGMGRLAMAQKAHERGFKVILTGEFLDLWKYQTVDVLTRVSSREGI